MYQNLVKVVGATCLIGGPLGELVWAVVWPGESGRAARDNIAAINANPGAAEVGLWLDLLILLLIPAALFAGRALQAGARALSGIATGVLFLGSLVFTYALAGDVVLVVGAAHLGTATAQAFFDSGVVSAATMIGVVLQVAGFVLLGIAALRSRLIPVWAGILLIAWNLVQIAGTALEISVLAAVGDALLLAAYAACAVRLFRPPTSSSVKSARTAPAASA